MAVTLIGAEGLFTRAGKNLGFYESIKTHLDAIDTDVDTDIRSEYTSDPRLASQVVDNIETLKSTAASNASFIQSVIRTTFIEMVNDDTKLIVKTLLDAVTEIISQMEASSDDINANTVGGSGDTAPDSGTGNGRLILDLTDGEGKSKEYVVAENITVDCTKDAQISGTSGRETFSVNGKQPTVGRFSEDWPDGSGASKTVVATHPSVDASSGVGFLGELLLRC